MLENPELLAAATAAASAPAGDDAKEDAPAAKEEEVIIPQSMCMRCIIIQDSMCIVCSAAIMASIKWWAGLQQCLLARVTACHHSTLWRQPPLVCSHHLSASPFLALQKEESEDDDMGFSLFD